MKVYAEEAQRLLDEQDEVPGYAGLSAEVVDVKDGYGTLKLKGGGHATVEGFAHAAGISEASDPAPEVPLIAAPEIQGIPHVGQWLIVKAGEYDFAAAVGEKEDGLRTDLLSQAGGWQCVEHQWVYDDGETEDEPVIIPEGDPQGVLELQVPPAALGRTIKLKALVGSSVYYSEPVGPVADGLTEVTLVRGGVADRDIISAEPQKLSAAAAKRLGTPVNGSALSGTEPGEAGDVTDPPPIATRRHT